jgi:hypothetical protein
VQRETHLVVKRERALLLVQWETHLVVKRETVSSISPSPPQIPSLEKSRRPEANLHLSTPLHTVCFEGYKCNGILLMCGVVFGT